MLQRLISQSLYLQNTTSVVGNTTLVAFELLFEVESLMKKFIRSSTSELLFTYYTKRLRVSLSLLTFTGSDNNISYNFLYRQETSNLDLTSEIFTLLTLSNLLHLESSGFIDFSLILGSLIHSQLTGSLGVSNIWYRSALTNFFLF